MKTILSLIIALFTFSAAAQGVKYVGNFTGNGNALTNLLPASVYGNFTGSGIYMTRFGTNANASGSGDVVAAGQNNFSGSNYFAGAVRFSGTNAYVGSSRTNSLYPNGGGGNDWVIDVKSDQYPNGEFAIADGQVTVRGGFTVIGGGGVVADLFTGSGASLTSIPASGLAAGGTFPAINGSALTALTYNLVTNAINTGVLAVGKTTFTNITGNITSGAFSGVDQSFNQWAKLWVTNSTATDYKVTLPAAVCTATNAFVIGQDVWVTNKSAVTISFDLAAFGTNAAAVRFQR